MELNKFVGSIDKIDTSTVKLRFVYHEDERYLSYSPTLADDLKVSIAKQFIDRLNIIVESRTHREDYQEVEYDPSVSPQKGETEFINPNTFANLDKKINEQIMTNPQPMSKLAGNWKKIQFVVVEFSMNATSMVFFYNFNAGKNVGPNLRAQVLGTNRFTLASSNTIGIDDRIDLLLVNGRLWVFAHNVVESFFYLSKYFKDQKDDFFASIDQIQQQLLSSGELKEFVFDEFLQKSFDKYCSQSQTRLKSIWHINQKPAKLNKFFRKIDNLPGVIDRFNLSFECRNNKIVVQPDSENQGFADLIKCLSDKYYLSLLLEEPGIDEGKR